MNNFPITIGDDFHAHFRQDQMLRDVIGFTAKHFRRATAMPNTLPTIATGEQAEAYHQEQRAALPGSKFQPIMAIMLTWQTTPKIIREAAKRGVRVLKFIPYGVSTNADESLPLDYLTNFYECLEAAQECGMIFSVHWERRWDADGNEIPEIKREEAALMFFERTVKDFPDLRIIGEHASTKRMIDFVRSCSGNVASTLTVHHATHTYHDVFDDDNNIINPFLYCKPVLKSLEDMAAVIGAIISGDKHFFFGSDSAPHPIEAKLRQNPAAGIFSAPVAMAILVDIFVNYAALNRLEPFIAHHGADFYLLPRNTDKITIVRQDWLVEKKYGNVVPFMADQILRYKVAE